MNPLDFTGKRVLVVGGSSGIGNGIAQRFRAAGAEVHVWGTRASASDYAAEDGSDLEGLRYRQLDVSDLVAIGAVDPGFDALDVLVASQGIVLYGRKEFQMETFERVVDVNLNSVMACAMRFREMLAASRGAMIVLSSIMAYAAGRGTPAYAASKAAAKALVGTLGQAWASDGIRVNGIAPGFVATRMTRVTTNDPARLKATEERIPLGRFGTPEEMADAAIFLASPMSSYIVGQTLVVDGGYLL